MRRDMRLARPNGCPFGAPTGGQVFSGSEHMTRICARVSKKFAYGVFGAKFGPAACVSGPANHPGAKNRGAQL